MNKAALLYQSVKKLHAISDEALELFFSAAEYLSIPKGENILRENEVCRFIFFVDSGFLRLFETGGGLEINTAFVFEGGFATSLKSLRTGQPSTITIQALEETNLYRFGKEDLLSCYKASHEIETLGRHIVEQLLVAQEEHSTLFKLYNPTARYKYLLDKHPELIQRVKLTHLASYLGMARETLSRIRAK